MKLSGSTFVWLAGIGFVWALGSMRAAGDESGTSRPAGCGRSIRPAETLCPSRDALRLLRDRSAEYPCLAPKLLRPWERRTESFATVRGAVERVRIGRTPELRRGGAVSFNRFVFRREASGRPGR